jgi:hypothetical protein
MSESMHDLYQRLCADERFEDVGAGLGRAVVDDVMIYEITLSNLDAEPDVRAAAEEFAAKHGLVVLEAGDGTLVLRRPNPSTR